MESIQWPPSEQGLANGRWACRVLVIRLLDSGELGMLVRASGRLKLVINLGVYSCQEFVLGSSILEPDNPTGKYSCQDYWVVVPDSATGKYIILQCTLYSSNCKKRHSGPLVFACVKAPNLMFKGAIIASKRN